jgi:D-glycero-D-manno-heptose 1,7-bisphosphate phosphatase
MARRLKNPILRAAFLDRDGVLVESIMRDGKPTAPRTLEEFRLVDGAGAQVARLKSAGLRCIVVTNQPEVARGLIDPAVLTQMNARLPGVDDVWVCAHDSDTGCACHKPKPGLLIESAKKWSVDVRRSFMVGDRWRDVDAGRAAGAFSILIRHSYSGTPAADAEVDSLAAAVDLILEKL